MVKKFLKIAGVKTEAEFYKKYPSEVAFFKAHPEAKDLKQYRQGGQQKKLNQLTSFEGDVDNIIPMSQIGSIINQTPAPQPFQPIDFQQFKDSYDKQFTGSTEAERQAEQQRQAEMQKQQSSSAGGGMPGLGDISKLTSMMGGAEGAAAALPIGKKGKKLKKAQVGTQQGLGLNSPAAGTMTGVTAAGANPYMWNSSPDLGTPQAPTAASVGMAATPVGQAPATTGSVGNLPAPKRSGAVDFASSIPMIGGIVSGIQGLFDEREMRRRAEQQAKLSDITLQASMLKPEREQRKYVRPEDTIIQPEQLFPSYGVGTNVLARNGSVVRAQTGMQIGGNLTEIQNMYNPGDIYQDLGYEPLRESDVIKQYVTGGTVDPNVTGGLNLLGSFSGQLGGAMGGGGFEANAGSQAGGAIGGAIGNAIAPGVGGQVGQIAGSLLGGALDQAPRKIKAAQEKTQKNVNKAAAASMAQGLQSQYSAYVKNGGWVSNDWLPQVITKFGEYDVEDLLKEDPMMDTLRTGGHIRQNYTYPQDQFNLGGSLQTTWGGYAEPISQNPYLPGTGETVMFRGNSHEEGDGKGRTGIGVKYGGDDGEYYPYMEYGRDGVEDVTDVEVERGEPAIELPDGETGENSMVVFGNLKVPKEFIPQAGGKKFKNYVKGLSEKEGKLSKSLDKDVESLDSLEIYTPFDKLKMDALQANLIGKNMKLKNIADKKTEAASVQSALNDTAKEYGLDADALAKGKVKIDKKAQKEMARFGKEIFKAQDGDVLPTLKREDYEYLKGLYNEAKKYEGKGKSDKVLKFQKEYHRLAPDFARKVIGSEPLTTYGKKEKLTTSDLESNEDLLFGKRTKQYMAELDKSQRPPAEKITIPGPKMPEPKFKQLPKVEEKPIPQKAKFPWEDLLNQVTPFLRPTDVDYNVDLSPEMMALSMNQLEPVPAQLYQPQLLTPYDVSYQDQLNEVTAQSRAAERMAGQDPAAAAAIMAQASRAKSSILGEQFRQNQAQRMGVYNQNIGTLNDAKLKNLAILDEQAKRQAMARSNTKAQAQTAANSISDKIAKNRLENKTLQTYENLYNYRFDDQGRAINYNPLAQFNTTANPGSAQQAAPEGYEYETILKKKKSKSEDTGRNGRIVKAMKGF